MSKNTASLVIKAFGGPTKIASALGIPITTAHSWGRTGSIPTWRVPAILDAADVQGVTLPKAFLKKHDYYHGYEAP